MRISPFNTVAGQRRWIGLSSISLITLITIVMTGLPGLFVGVILAISWYWLTAEQTFTFGQFILLAVVSDLTALSRSSNLTFGLLILAEVGLLIMLLTPPDTTQALSREASLMIVGGITLTVIASWIVIQSLRPLWLTVAGLIGVGGFVIYAINQYEQYHLSHPTKTSNHE